MMTRRPRSWARRINKSRFWKLNFPGCGSAVVQSTQVLTVLKPTALIASRSLPQRSALLESICSSMGARASPPLYQTATGKNGADSLGVGTRARRTQTPSARQRNAPKVRTVLINILLKNEALAAPTRNAAHEDGGWWTALIGCEKSNALAAFVTT